MVEPLAKRLESICYLGVIDEPARARVYFAAHSYLTAKRVAVQPRAFVPLRDVRQAVSRLESELFYKLYDHLSKSYQSNLKFEI